MNTHSTALQEQHTRYADIRKRLMGSPAKAPVKKTAIAAVIETFVRARQIPPMWKAGQIHFDAHVVTWQSVFPQQRINALIAENTRLREALRITKDDEDLSRLPRRAAREIIDEVLSQYPGVKFKHVKTRRSASSVIGPRDACIVAVHDERADMSSKQIGDLFDVDRTTVNYVILKAAAARGDKEAIEKVEQKRSVALNWYYEHGRVGTRARKSASQ
jgi:hypothetical protein